MRLVRTPTASELQRLAYERCAKSLADTVAAFLVSGTAGNAEAMHEALQCFTRARKVLEDG